jgi:hypothetical protein
MGMQDGAWGHYLLLHFDSGGQLDPDFGDQGVMSISRAGYQISHNEQFAIDSQGRVLLSVPWKDAAENPLAEVFRFGTDHTLDAGFGNGGTVDLGAYWPLFLGVDAQDEPVIIAP